MQDRLAKHLEAPSQSFVVFPLGSKRFAIKAEFVTELAHPDSLQIFPHTTPLITGVLVRRARIIPVCDIASALMGGEMPPRKYYLIAKRQMGSGVELMAIPVSGDCELATGEIKPAPPMCRLPHYATGVLPLEHELIEVVDLDKLLDGEDAA